MQNYDVGYRPDGIRFVADSKTLNDKKSVGKNGWNMINDLATEATTVHARFPYAVVGFIVVIPEPAIDARRQTIMIETLERLVGRPSVDYPLYLAEAISFVIWDPPTGEISDSVPARESVLRLERFSEQVEGAYVPRYKGDPPHRPILVRASAAGT